MSAAAAAAPPSTMKQAQVTTWGAAPHCATVPTPALPAETDELVQIRVLAASLPTLVRARAAGTHYSTAAARPSDQTPHVPGVDGVGATVPDGRLVYFATFAPLGGTFAQYVNAPRAALVPVPVDAEKREKADPVQIAGQMNPVMASWMALAARTRDVRPGFTAVVVGATGLAGAAAVGVARAFGAGRVVGVGRDAAKMRAEGLGLDAVVVLDGERTDYGEAAGADVVLDFLYGPPTLGLLRALKPKGPVQYVQIGTVVDRDMALPGEILRSKDITIRGAGPGAWRMEDFAAEAPRMIEAIVAGKIRPYKFQEVKLEDIEEAWGQKGGDRMVIVP
ncbi:hypothetical protein SLS58_002215 [Diplodia intermedia]|uniref:Alcohol dehydrogenase n=1 Tax=Diplodia intermedia TaxID=856260 RepID=A0ABR3TZZ8_9PEZI